MKTDAFHEPVWNYNKIEGIFFKKDKFMEISSTVITD